ncbi:MAG: DNA helicase II [Gammaproteobacteria bacterium RIFCSPLOWO2_02_FULL_42_14]|nr:MAG: DNA helicase II [Gammaproteobacteria bacterium RIFCSPHIGHO2_02_FULL_42_43]OGT51429.1 MAG: DNA helicase II [Gammaproteobacteria bacterium RIFCSPHIGHO2_12_FULL_41_25]OGT62131.1 MAG: DNA helicase II [Gammaproteobacteria bacterium RIFCSPLOWO2_02_FULL_42_14]OGT85803.1 MAG: DNA helicase II [Gammaproteobacteria bacterium RIFCSPLOWO2_12_FULL_42_18]
MSEFHHITESLNDHQKAAVSAPLQHLLVLAGAGSGKTRVLVHRMAYLMAAHGVSPYEIIAVTFTNKAANEMRERIEKLRGVPSSQMWVGTFHGLSHRMLRTHFSEAGLPQTFQIIDSEDQLRLVKRIHRAMELDESRWPSKQSQWFINNKKESGFRANQIQCDGSDYTTEKLLHVYREYEATCTRSGIVDFTELLLRSYELLKNNESIQSHYQKRFSHILVDEFQDTNDIQYRWLKAIAGDKSFLMAVGDDDQSIYSWRGAQVKNIQHFTRDFKNAQTIRLEQNYRSTKNILDAANAVIDNNKNRLGKTLWTVGSSGEPLTLFEAFNEREEAGQVVSEIKQIAHQGISLNDFAILYRSNAQSRVLEEALIEAKIPYRIYGGFKFFERAEIKDALCYLRLLVNRNDDAAFERVINTPVRGIGQTTLSKVRDQANQQKISLWDSAKKCLADNAFSARAHAALSGFIELIDRLTQDTRTLKLAECVDLMLVKTGLLASYITDKSEKGLSKTENLRELVNATSEFVAKSEHENLSELEAFLADVILETGEQQADVQTDCVSLMTLHAAKGLEFPVIFMVGMEEQLFPHQMSIAERNGLEEERRLCYVGMTRAMKKLFLSCAEYRQLHGQGQYNAPSRFIAEIPDHLIHRVRPKLSAPQPSAYASENRQYFVKGIAEKKKSKKQLRESVGGFSVGQRVTHPKFGSGVIIDYEGSGDATRVQVKFENAGAKWLVLNYAKLT